MFGHNLHFFFTKNQNNFEKLLEDYYQESLDLYRINATYLGDERYNDSLPNFLSKEFQRKQRNFFNFYLDKLYHFDDKKLLPDQLLSKKLLIRELELDLRGLNFKKNLMPIDQMWTFQLDIGQLASGKGAQPFNSLKDYQNWLVRLDGYLKWMASAEQKMREGMQSGYVLPKSLIVKVLPQLKPMTEEDVHSHLFFSPVKNFPEHFSEAEKLKLTSAYTEMISEQIIPAYKKLYNFMDTEYMEAGRESSGYHAFPDGVEYYKYAIEVYTTTKMSSEEIHDLGLKEVARIRSEMEMVMKEVGFNGSLKDFFKFVRNSRSLMPFNYPNEVILNFNRIYDKIKPE